MSERESYEWDVLMCGEEMGKGKEEKMRGMVGLGVDGKLVWVDVWLGEGYDRLVEKELGKVGKVTEGETAKARK
ncbi:hypothetical protein, partial [Cytobacillus oceanisediminis]|uniref:hypothetical protein n=1 Tax=Cytobacillus oceanisediminis TaxID=665099 RepID=UPI0011A651C8